MLAIITETPQPSSFEEANEKKAPPCLLTQMAKQLPFTVIDRRISFSREDFSIIEKELRKKGFFVRLLDTTKHPSEF